MSRPIRVLVVEDSVGHNGVCGVIVDISERRGAEQQLRLQDEALRAAENAIVIAARDGAVQWVDDAFRMRRAESLILSAIKQDITERREAEEALRRAMAELERRSTQPPPA